MTSNFPKDIPIAMLVIYDTGFKFKYKKYYLKKGNNIIGWNSACNIIISDGPKTVDKAANL